MFKNRLNYGIINTTALMLLLYISFSNINLWWQIISKCISVLLPFIIGFAFAYALTPLVRYFQKKGVNSSLANIIVILGIIIIIFGLLALTLPVIYA